MFREPPPQAEHRINENIHYTPVRVVDSDGEQVGVLAVDEARIVAADQGKDLVEIAPNARPPVCKIMDFGKFKYQQKKKDHKAKQKQHQVVVKEIRVRPKTDKHDIETKIRIARGFLEKGNRLVSLNYAKTARQRTRTIAN